MRKLSLLSFLSIIVQFLYAQHSISGTITDLMTGEPLIGVNVYAPVLSIGTVTDIDGTYKLADLLKGDIVIQYS